MNFSFDGDFAKEHGVNEAIMYQYFSYWIAKNRANDKHFYDGYTWTYNSQKALTELFPFWNRAKIQRIISSLENQGLLIKGNYNQLAYDRTTWYALPKFEQSVVQNQTVNCSDLNNERFKNEQPIPINYQLTKQLTNKDIKDIVEHGPTEPVPYQEVVEYLNQKTGKNFKHTSKVTQRHIRARLAEGFTVSDFKQVIDKKCSDWLRDQKMKEYLRPETLFGTKFESYLNSKTTTAKQTGPYIDSCGLKVL